MKNLGFALVASLFFFAADAAQAECDMSDPSCFPIVQTESLSVLSFEIAMDSSLTSGAVLATLPVGEALYFTVAGRRGERLARRRRA